MQPNRSFSNSNYGRLPFQKVAILLPFGRRSFLPALVERYHGEPIDMGVNTDREAYTLRTPNGLVTLIYSGMGSPVTANALEKAAANGIERMVLLGACGGAARQVNVGDIIVPTQAIRGEGTSRYYQPESVPAKPDAEMATRLADLARQQSQSTVHEGVVFTTDASYRQGPEVYERKDRPVLAVDCECSAAFVVAATLGLRLAAIFFCTDNVLLDDPAYRSRQGVENATIRESLNCTADVAVAVLGS